LPLRLAICYPFKDQHNDRHDGGRGPSVPEDRTGGADKRFCRWATDRIFNKSAADIHATHLEPRWNQPEKIHDLTERRPIILVVDDEELTPCD
jgi:hypothetical protein